MSIKNKLLIGAATALSLGTAANAQTEEHFSCGHDHTKNSPTEQSIQPRDGNYMWNDCDTIRTALISILPTPRTDNWDMFYEGLQNVVDQTDVQAIENVKHVQMNWSEMVPWLQAMQTTDQAHGYFATLDYDNMPTALADSLRNIIEEHGPDAIYLEVPYDMPGKNIAVGGPGRGMIIIKSYNSDPMYKAAIGHELAHEMGQSAHDDSMNNIMNSSLSGNTSPLFTEEHKANINDKYDDQLINTNPDRNCAVVGVEDIQIDENSIKLYPNPVTSSHFTLESVAEPITRVRMFNQLGQLYSYLPRDTQEAHLLDISLDGLTAGIWYATVETEKGNVTKKVFIAK